MAHLKNLMKVYHLFQKLFMSGLQTDILVIIKFTFLFHESRLNY